MKTEKKEKAVMVLGILKSVVTFFIKMFSGKKKQRSENDDSAQ